MKFVFPATIIPTVLLTIAAHTNYFIYDLKDDSYFMPVSIWYKCLHENFSPFIFHARSSLFRRLPFDWKTPLGYSLANIFLSVSLFGQFLGTIATVCLSAGFSWLLISFAESITNDVKNLKCKRTRNRKLVEMQKMLRNIIVDLSDMKQ